MNAMLEQINAAGEDFVNFAGPMLVQVSVLILIVLAVDLLLKKKVRAVFRYCLWMLVLVKLVLPVTLSSPFSLGYLIGDQLNTQVNVQEPAAEIGFVLQRPLAVDRIDSAPIEAAAAVEDSGPASAEGTGQPLTAEPASPLKWEGVVFLVWAVIVVVMMLMLLQRAFFVFGLVAQAKKAGGMMEDVLERCKEKMGMRGKVGLKLSANATSPAVCGLVRPVILVPQDLEARLDGNEMRAVLMHELAHIRRGDLWVNLAQTVLQIVYFYNPLLWVANAIIRRVREQAVDEAVLVAMGEGARQYPRTLVNVAKLAFGRPALSLRLIGVVESKNALKGRVKRILERPLPKTAKLGIAGLIMVLFFGSILLPMAKFEPAPPDFVVKGTVTDAETGQPIAGAKVGDNKEYNDGKFCTVTDSDGNYEYKTWYEEHFTKCQAAGYKTENKILLTKLFGSEKEKVIDFELTRGEDSGPSEFKASLGGGVTVEAEDIKPADFDIRLDPKRGVCNLVVSIQNDSEVTIPKFKLRFYRGKTGSNLDEAGNVHSGWHEAGPIEPDKEWNEGTRDFHLPDGEYEFNVVLDYDDNVPEVDEDNNQAVVQVKVQNDRIVEKSVICPGKIENSNFAGEVEGESELEVLDIDFEPIHQGKNVVRVKVKNKSGEEQVFGIHIYTRSVDYGPQGVGWGRPFFDKIEAGETKTVTSPFNIQGPVTKNTWLRLKFYNPESVETYDYEKPFQQKRFASGDLERQQVVATAEELKQLSKALEVIKAYIRDREYKNAWQLFTEDYQQVQFVGKGLERFEQAMEPAHPTYSAFSWKREDFLSLEPLEAIYTDGRYKLTAQSLKGETWTIDFVKEDEVWRIDWIAGYKPGIFDIQEADRFSDLLDKPVSVDIDHSPDGDRLTIQYAVMAICEAAGVPYQREKSAELADPQRRRYIEPIHIKDVPAIDAIADILGPFGLIPCLDEDGLYLYKVESEAEPLVLLGMQLIDLTPELQAKYQLHRPFGVLVLDPGFGYQRLGIEKLQKGYYFRRVGTKMINNIREMITEILRINAKPKPAEGDFDNEGHKGYVLVGYSSRKGGKGEYLQFTEEDIKELRRAGKALGIPDDKLYYGDEKEVEYLTNSADMLYRLWGALQFFANDHGDKYPENLSGLLNEQIVFEEDGLALLKENIEYLGGKVQVVGPPDAILAYDKTLLMQKDSRGTNVLYNDGRISFEKTEKLKKLGIKTER